MKILLSVLSVFFLATGVHASMRIDETNSKIVALDGTEAEVIDSALRVALKVNQTIALVQSDQLQCNRLGMGKTVCYAGFMKQIPEGFAASVSEVISSCLQLVLAKNGGQTAVTSGEIIRISNVVCESSPIGPTCKLLYGARSPAQGFNR